jgi:hypothetical protein
MATQRKKPADLHKEDLDWIKKGKLLNRPDFVETVDGAIVAVYCKRCGSKIQGLVPSAAEPKVFREGGRIIEQRMVRLGPLPLYTEVEIQCDDGSKHVAACCKECAPFLTADELDAFLIADTDAEIKEAERSGRPMKDRLLENRVMRRVDRKEKKG